MTTTKTHARPPLTLAQQIKRAEKDMAKWPQWKLRNMRLQGSNKFPESGSLIP